MRSITHTLRAEEAPSWWVAAWVVLGFVPLTFVLARPLARWLGLANDAQPLTTVGHLVGDGAATAPKDVVASTAGRRA
jgi:hypothetical protein